jgi:hypothetical protein
MLNIAIIESAEQNVVVAYGQLAFFFVNGQLRLRLKKQRQMWTAPLKL